MNGEGSLSARYARAAENGFSEVVNGSSRPTNGVVSRGGVGNDDDLDGHDEHDHEEGAHQPFPSTSSFKPIYPGSQIDRAELVRLTLQCLQDAGYP